MYLSISEAALVMRTLVDFLQKVKDEDAEHKRIAGNCSCYIAFIDMLQDATHVCMPHRARVGSKTLQCTVLIPLCAGCL